MFGRALLALAKVSRLDTSLIVFLSVAVPLGTRTHDIGTMLGRALPILAISMCGFILNDLHDVERDQTNHPNRPLPRDDLTETTAAIAYFVLLGAALVSVRTYVDTSTAFLYVLLLIGLINYNYVVSYFPYLKNVYVAAISVIPVLIVSLFLQWGFVAWIIMGALFIFVLGREILMDALDTQGDNNTFVKLVGERAATITGFSFQIGSAATLLIASSNRWAWFCATAMLIFNLVAAVIWRWTKLERLVLHATKIQFVLGIAYMSIA